jgi:hypothetical protein
LAARASIAAWALFDFGARGVDFSEGVEHLGIDEVDA